MKATGIVIIILFGTLLPAGSLLAQITVNGHVYQDKYRTPLDSVTVFTQSGRSVHSDSTGSYHIRINAKDSLWFQYRDKITHKYPTDTIKNRRDFEVQIYLPKEYMQNPKGYLPTVTVRSRNYREDSLAFREDYAKIFNYQKPGKALGQSFGVGDAGGVAVDMDALVNVFRFGYNRRQRVYQKFALSVEQDRYIDHRFTKKLVEEITGLYDAQRDKYMETYRPGYDALLLMNDAQLSQYIKSTYQEFLHQKSTDKYEQNIFLSPYERREDQRGK